METHTEGVSALQHKEAPGIISSHVNPPIVKEEHKNAIPEHHEKDVKEHPKEAAPVHQKDMMPAKPKTNSPTNNKAVIHEKPKEDKMPKTDAPLPVIHEAAKDATHAEAKPVAKEEKKSPKVPAEHKTVVHKEKATEEHKGPIVHDKKAVAKTHSPVVKKQSPLDHHEPVVEPPSAIQDFIKASAAEHDPKVAAGPVKGVPVDVKKPVIAAAAKKV